MVATTAPGRSTARQTAAIISSEPLPTTMRSVAMPSFSPSAVRKAVQAGSQYRAGLRPASAAVTFGEHPSGFSLLASAAISCRPLRSLAAAMFIPAL